MVNYRYLLLYGAPVIASKKHRGKAKCWSVIFVSVNKMLHPESGWRHKSHMRGPIKKTGEFLIGKCLKAKTHNFLKLLASK
jgi:hypothetical protein